MQAGQQEASHTLPRKVKIRFFFPKEKLKLFLHVHKNSTRERVLIPSLNLHVDMISSELCTVACARHLRTNRTVLRIPCSSLHVKSWVFFFRDFQQSD